MSSEGFSALEKNAVIFSQRAMLPIHSGVKACCRQYWPIVTLFSEFELTGSDVSARGASDYNGWGGHYNLTAGCRVSSKWKKNNFGSNRNKPKQTETKSVSRLFRFVSWNQKKNFSVCFGVSNLYRNNRNKQNCFETNRNND